MGIGRELSRSHLRLALNKISLITFLLVSFLSSYSWAELYIEYQDETGLSPKASSLHFTVFADSQEVADQALQRFEEALQDILASLHVKKVFANRCLVFIWGTKEDYIKRADQYQSSYIDKTMGFASVGLQRKHSRIFLYEDDLLFSEVIPHELAHLVLELILDPLGQYFIPPWLHEGFAQFYEKTDNSQSLVSLKIAKVRDKLIPLKELFALDTYPADPLKKRIFYLESEALARFLFENQTNNGEFLSFCSNFLVWDKEPEKDIKRWFGGKFPDLDTLQEKWIFWLEQKTKEVSIDKNNNFLQPGKRYRAACRYFAEGETCEEAGEDKEALSNYELAKSELEYLCEEDPQWSSQAVKELLAKSRSHSTSLEKDPSSAGEENVKEISGRQFSFKLVFTFNQRVIIDTFGEPSSVGKIKLGKKGSDTDSDKFRITYCKYSDHGLNFIFRRNRVIGVDLIKPFKGNFRGVELECSRKEVHRILGSRVEEREDRWSGDGDERKVYLRMDIIDGRARFRFEDDKLTSIELRKNNALGSGYRWSNF